MIRLFLRLLFIFLGIYIFYLIWKFLTATEKKEETQKKIVDENLVKDPVCGLYIPESKAVKLRVKNKDYYFCSNECKEKFLKELNNNG
jgi:YHS domain-containing protein